MIQPGSGSTLAPRSPAAPPADIIVRLAKAAAQAFAGTPIVLAYAYGSRVWGTPHAASDLDVGYYLAPGGTARRLRGIVELRLADRLSEVMGYEVDLRGLADAPLGLRGRVLEEGAHVYCSDEVARVTIERDLLGRYHDYKPELEALRALRFAALAAKEA